MAFGKPLSKHNVINGCKTWNRLHNKAILINMIVMGFIMEGNMEEIHAY